MKKINRKDLFILLLMIIVIVINGSLIFNDSLWGDEAYTMLMIKKDFSEIILATAKDVHPPLYYFITKIFTMLFGYSVPIVKIVSIIPVALTMICVWLKSKKIFKENYILISSIFILLIGISPRALPMNVELRMYTWAMFFTTCSALYAYEIYLNQRNNKKVILFIFLGVCAAYTHYYAGIVEACIYIFLLVHLIIKSKNWKLCSVIVISTIILYVPWLPVFIKQFTVTRQNWWATTFAVDFGKYFFEGKFLNEFLIIVSVIVLNFIEYIRMKKKDEEAHFAIYCVLSFILMLVIGWGVSIIIRPLFIDRFMYTRSWITFFRNKCNAF